MEHGLVAGIHPADSGERLPGAGGDQLLARVATAGPCPITLVEDTSADREWAPLRVPHGTARFLMLTVGAPSLGFLREVGEVYATGPTLERLVEVAGRHGVRPAFDLPDA
jgi:hypothetical protein